MHVNEQNLYSQMSQNDWVQKNRKFVIKRREKGEVKNIIREARRRKLTPRKTKRRNRVKL